jgi:hypothetical protein
VTYVSGDQATTPMKFFYDPESNGPFPIPPYPEPRIEGGYWNQGDRHVILVDHDNCRGYEIFSLYGSVQGNSECRSCTAQSGARIDYQSNGLLVKGGTDVASLPLTPLIFRPDELKAGEINHALRVTLFSPRNTYLWPALGSSNVYTTDSKAPPVGARFRLRPDFDISGFSPTAQVILTALRKYGLIVADRGYNWNVTGSGGDFDNDALNAMSEIWSKVNGDHLEAVDQSSLMISADSAETLDGEPVVIATSVANRNLKGQTAVRLFGVAVGVPNLTEAVQAGATKQLVAWVGGASDASVTWTMKPALGDISPTGVYTAPDEVSSPQSTTLTATSKADPAKSATLTLTVVPKGVIRVNVASTKDYVDSEGNTWWADVGYHGGTVYTFPELSVPGAIDLPLYLKARAGNSDIFYTFAVPNGAYKATVKMAEPIPSQPGFRNLHLEAQGQIIYRDVDPVAIAGKGAVPLDFDMPVLVTDGSLTVAIRNISGYGPLISALQISPDAGNPQITISPADGGSVSPLQSKQFYAVLWYSPKNVPLKWSISPKVGSIDDHGTYKGPAQPVSEPVAVTITAESREDATISASAVVTVLPGVPDIRVNCGSLPGFTDAQGRVWSSDFGSSAGVVYDDTTVTIQGATPDMQRLYQSARYLYDDESFRYSFTTPNSDYNVTLKFAEFVYDDAGHHIFDVKINGKQVLTNFDIAVAAGGGRHAYDRTFRTTVTDNVLRIDFIGHKGGALINGIEITHVPASQSKQDRLPNKVQFPRRNQAHPKQ